MKLDHEPISKGECKTYRLCKVFLCGGLPTRGSQKSQIDFEGCILGGDEKGSRKKGDTL